MIYGDIVLIIFVSYLLLLLEYIYPCDGSHGLVLRRRQTNFWGRTDI